MMFLLINGINNSTLRIPQPLEIPDTVKLNTCMLFFYYFYSEKVPDIPVSLVSELHNHNNRTITAVHHLIVIYPLRTSSQEIPVIQRFYLYMGLK